MTKRNEVLKFGKFNGLQIKSERFNGSVIVTVYAPKTEWVDCFSSWDEAHTALSTAVKANRDQHKPLPWAAH